MSVKIRFTSAAATRLVLAKIGNPQREEPLQTSKQVFEVDEADRAMLSGIFLKPFKNLAGYRFNHHSSLDQHEMNACAKAIFESTDGLLERAAISRSGSTRNQTTRTSSRAISVSLSWRTWK